jgi:hypothetical protein
MLAPSRKTSLFVPAVLAACFLVGNAALYSADNFTTPYQSDSVTRYQARVPLGWESFKVSSSGTCF